MTQEATFRDYIRYILEHHKDEGFYDLDGETERDRKIRYIKKWRDDNKEYVIAYSKMKRLHYMSSKDKK